MPLKRNSALRTQAKRIAKLCDRGDKKSIAEAKERLENLMRLKDWRKYQ